MTTRNIARLNLIENQDGQCYIQFISPNGAEASIRKPYPPHAQEVERALSHFFPTPIPAPQGFHKGLEFEALVDLFFESTGHTDKHDSWITWFKHAQQCIGSLLFEFLFEDQIATQLGKLLCASGQQPITLRLFIDTHNQRLKELPWELLYAPDHGFLSLNPSLCIARFMPSVNPSPLLTLALDQRIGALLLEAAPIDENYAIITTTREANSLSELLSEDLSLPGDMHFEHHQAIQYPQLVDISMQRGADFHILHFAGHGGLTDKSHGYVVFEDQDGLANPISSEVFATAVRRFPNLRLLYLNCCESAAIPDGGTFLSMGELIAKRCNIPALLAMQRPIRNDHAGFLASQFYERLIQTDIESAMSISRNLLQDYAKDADVNAWWTPVLYLQTQDLFFLDTRRGPGADQITPTPAVAA